MTPQQADKAIKAGKPVTVVDAFGSRFSITLTSRDRRTVSGTYEGDGKLLDGKFERSDLQLVS